MRWILTILLFKLLLLDASGQDQLRGKVIDIVDGTPKPGVSILFKNPSDSVTLAFAFSNQLGEFIIDKPTAGDSMLVQVSAMTIKKTFLKIALPQDWIEIKVESSELELEEVRVEGLKNPVSFKKDTVSYSVDGFSNTNDRVIADVIKRLPGIEVSENGMIRYQGQPLSKFYIDGLDLLQGRYNLANKNLPIGAVETVEILENHQPIRVLDSLVFSDRAALNLVLRKKNVWIGTGTAGLGAAPVAWNAAISPMVFRDTFQALISLRSNNFGLELGDEQKTLTISELQNTLEEKRLRDWFSVPDLRTGIIPRQRTLFNKSHMGSFNGLTKSSQSTEFRANIDFLRQDLDQATNAETVYFLPGGDSIRFTEKTEAFFTRQNLSSKLNWTKNLPSQYLENSFYFDIQSDQEQANTLFNEVNQSQEAGLPKLRLGNKLSVLAPVGNTLAEINSHTSFQRTNQQFDVAPGGFEHLVGDANSNETWQQNLLLTRFFTNNSFGFKRTLSAKMTLNFLGGVDFNMDRVDSELLKSDALGNEEDPSGDFSNGIEFVSVTPFAKSSIEFRSSRFTGRLEVPARYAWIEAKDAERDFMASLSKPFVEPSLYLRYQINGKLFTTASLRKYNTFGTGEDIYSNPILTTFRSFELRNTDIPERITNGIDYGLSFKDPISAIFLNLNLGYQHLAKNTIIENTLLASGETVFSAKNLSNTGNIGTLAFRGSKYLTDLFTTLTLSSTFQRQKTPQLTNNKLLDYTLASNIYSLESATKPKRNFGFVYRINFTTIKSSDNDGTLGEIVQWGQNATLELFPIENHLIKTSFEFVYNRTEAQNGSQQAGFLDISYTYKVPNSRISFDFLCVNALGSRDFRTFFANGFVLSSQQFPLRPRQLMLQVNFSF